MLGNFRVRNARTGGVSSCTVSALTEIKSPVSSEKRSGETMGEGDCQIRGSKEGEKVEGWWRRIVSPRLLSQSSRLEAQYTSLEPQPSGGIGQLGQPDGITEWPLSGRLMREEAVCLWKALPSESFWSRVSLRS